MKLKIALAVAGISVLLFPILVWWKGWFIPSVYLSLVLTTVAIMRWIEPLEKFLRKVRGDINTKWSRRAFVISFGIITSASLIMCHGLKLISTESLVAIVLLTIAIGAIYWFRIAIKKRIDKLTGRIRGLFKPKTGPPPPVTPPLDMGDYGSQLSKAKSVLACLTGIALVLGALSLLLLYLIGSWQIAFVVGTKTYTLSWLPLLLIPTGFYIAGSFQKVNEDENAVKVAFGYMFEDVGPGLTFVPKWACKLVRITSKVITLAGGTPEKVKAAERGESLGVAATDQFTQARLVQNDDELMRVAGGTIRVTEEATRITFAEKKTALYFDDSDEAMFRATRNPLSSQFTTDPKIVMSLLIPKAGIRMLVRRFGSPFGALREIDELMTSHLQTVCSRITTEYFVYRVDDVALMLQLILEKLLGDEHEITGGADKPKNCLSKLGLRIEAIQSLGRTGVDVKSLRLETGLPKAVNVALKGVVEADIKIQTATNIGEATRVGLEREGAGKASAERASALAKADGRRALLEAEAVGRRALIEASNSPMGILLAQLEATKDALASNSKVIIAQEGGNILGTIVNIRETLRQLEEEATKKLPGTASPTPPAPPATI